MPQIFAAPYPKTELVGTLNTSPGDRPLHYSGKRRLTVREEATIQCFPFNHEFAPGLTQKSIATQIGNAVPATFIKMLFGEAIRCLREEDGVEHEDGRSAGSAFGID